MLSLSIPKFTLAEGYASYHRSQQLLRSKLPLVKKLSQDIVNLELPQIEKYNHIPVEKLAEDLGALDYTRLETLLQGKFYNPAIMQLFSRLLLAIYREEDVSGLKVETIHHWLEKVSRLSEGVNGVTLQATLEGMVSPEVILKYAKQGELVHEIFVGLFGTNKLRNFIPNFSFVYGGFPCSPPFILDKRLLTYCEKDAPAGEITNYYALYENISPGISFIKLLFTFTEKEFIDLYFQTLLALQFAYEQVGYTHFDLHGENLIIRELPEEVLLHYPLEVGTYYLKTKYIVTFIDYGYSSITYKGVVYYRPDAPLFLGLGNVSSFPLYDAFTLLAYSYQALQTRKLSANSRMIFKLTQTLLTFFTQAKGAKLNKYLQDTHRALPTSYAQYSLQTLIDFLLSFTPSSLVRSKEDLVRSKEELENTPLFFCSDNCKSLTVLERNLLLSKENKANDLFQLYYLLVTTGDYDYLRSFPKEKLIEAEKKLNKDLLEYLKLRDNFPQFALNNLDNKRSKEIFDNYLISLAKTYRLYKEIELEANILLYLSNYLPLNLSNLKKIPPLNIIKILKELRRDLTIYKARHPRENIKSYREEVDSFLLSLD